MTLSDLSIRRPVFATVLSLLLLIVGVMATLRLSLREYPDISQPVVSVNVNYRGANAAVVETRITQILENEVAGLEGVDKLTSSSRDERSQISVQFTANRDIESAANDVREPYHPRAGASARRSRSATDREAGQRFGSGDVHHPHQQHPQRPGAHRLPPSATWSTASAAVPGVASVFINGARRYSMRVWPGSWRHGGPPHRDLRHRDRRCATRTSNCRLGRIESRQREFTLRTETSLRSEDDFRNLVIGRGQDGYLVRLGDVAPGAAGCREPARRFRGRRQSGADAAGVGAVHRQCARGFRRPSGRRWR